MDMHQEKCEECREGIYVETSIWDDLEGKLHCSVCGYEISRHREDPDE